MVSTARTSLVLLALMALLALTLVAVLAHLGPWETPVNLGIAGAKAAIVALWFMHVRRSSALTRVFAGAGLLWLTLLLGLTLSDYLSRGWM